MLVGVKL